MNQLAPTLNKEKGDILGFVMYAHGDQFGNIYNIANHTGWSSNVKRMHTREIINSLSQSGYKISKAYPMQCYSIFNGTAEVSRDWDLNRSTLFRQLRNLGYNPIVNNTLDSSGKIESSTLTLKIDLEAEWKNVAIEVNGYSGMNVIGIDTD